jgi:signal transduction histidine kinase
MKLRTKFSGLVACCTLVLLGSFYLLSQYTAERAILGFYAQSALVISNNILEDDDIDLVISRNALSIDNITSDLYQSFPEHFFILMDKGEVCAENISNENTSLVVNTISSGYQFTIKATANRPSIVQINKAQTEFEFNAIKYQLFWLPKIVLQQDKQKLALQQNLNQAFMWTLIGLSAVAIILSWLGSGYFLKPLQTLHSGLADLKAGRLDTRLLNKKAGNEVNLLLEEFNQLATWLQGLHQQYKQMNSDLGHELRTPLNALQSRIEALNDGIIEPSQHHYLQMQSDLTILTRLVNDLSLLSLTESGQLSLDISQFDMSELAQNVAARYISQASERGIKFNIDLPLSLRCTADKARTSQILINLLDNAFKYGTQGKYIKLHAAQQNNQVMIKITDKGAGLTYEQQANIFERFYRVDPARNDNRSLGLGLAISQQLAKLQNGTITVKSEPNQGCEFTLYLPKASIL